MTKKDFILEVIRKWEMVKSNTSGFTNEVIGGEFASNYYTVSIYEDVYISKDISPRFVCIIEKDKYHRVLFPVLLSDFTDTELSEIKFILSLKYNNLINDTISDAINKQ